MKGQLLNLITGLLLLASLAISVMWASRFTSYRCRISIAPEDGDRAGGYCRTTATTGHIEIYMCYQIGDLPLPISFYRHEALGFGNWSFPRSIENADGGWG